MMANKCFYVFLVSYFTVSVSKIIPTSLNVSDPAKDQFLTNQLIEDLETPQSEKRNSFAEPPQYMLDLYNEVADSGGLSKSPLPHGASLVRALPVQVFSERGFSFSLENVPLEETILEAEVHIHHHQLHSEQRKLLESENVFALNLFILGDTEEKLLLDSHTLGGHFSGWRVFSVGNAVKEARLKGDSKISFEVEAKTMEGETIDSLFHHSHHTSTNPILVLFAVTEKSDDPFPFQELSSRKALKSHPKSSRVTRSAKTTDVFQKRHSGCVLEHLPVIFDEIGWSWMVYPKEYDAYHCVGKCAFPLGQDYNPTNHATVISVVHYLADESQMVSYPSCVPTGYKGLSILYYDVEETVILKQFDRMVATECGCR